MCYNVTSTNMLFWIINAGGVLMDRIFRGLFATLNGLIFSFIETLYSFLMTLADVRVFSFETLKAFSTRIYAILAIFMAFKLTFAFITYAVDPEKLTEKGKGGKKLVVNIIISLALLIAIPNLVFPLSRELQSTILNDHILEQVILGTDPTVGTDAIDTKRSGRYLSFSILNGFFYPDENIVSSNTDDQTEDGGFKSCKNANMILDTTIENQDPSSQAGLENALYKLNGDCAAAILDQVDDAGDTVFWYETAYSQKSIKMLLEGDDAANLKSVKTKDGDFVFNFNYIISLAVGIVVVFMLINFCFKIAVRTIKLGFLELIAPIPILSFIDPSAKKKSFDGWVKECGKTYIDLFVRLVALYFAIFLITQVTRGGGLTYSDGSPVGGFVTVVIIIGALMFANEIPKLIESILGVKLDGGFSLNPFKKSPLAAGLVGGAIGAGLGAAANVHNLGKNIKKDGWKKTFTGGETGFKGASNVARNLFTGAGGFVGGGIRSGQAAVKGKLDNPFAAASKGVTTSSNNRELRAGGYTAVDKVRDKWTDMAGIKTDTGTTSVLKSNVKRLQQEIANSKERQESIRRSAGAAAQRVRSGVDVSETSRINKFKLTEITKPDGSKDYVRDYKYNPRDIFDVDDDGNITGKKATAAAIYAQYEADAIARGLDDASKRLDEKEFMELMNLEMQAWVEDDQTRELEKYLKKEQEKMEKAHPKK